MGFNYLQTDDRDDYFAQFDKHRKVKVAPIYQIIDDMSSTLFTGNSRECGNFAQHHFHLTARYTKKGRWKEILKVHNYSFEKKENNLMVHNGHTR